MQATPNEWQFINLNQPKESKNEDVRRVIRANAQRDFRRKQRQQAIHKHRKSLSNGTSTSNQSAELFRTPDGAQREEGQVLWHAALGEPLAELQELTPYELSNRTETIPNPDCTAALWPPYSALGNGTSEDNSHSGDSYRPVSPKTPLDPASVDPFNALPVQADTKYHSYILHHCKQ